MNEDRKGFETLTDASNPDLADMRKAFQEERRRQVPELAASPSANVAQKRDDTGRLTSDYEPTPHEIKVARDAICREFGNNGTDGYYIRILKAIHGAAPAANVAQENPTTISWNGFYLTGSRASVDEVHRLIRAAGRLVELEAANVAQGAEVVAKIKNGGE